MLIPFKANKVIICKSKGHPRKGHEGPEVEQMYSYTLSLTSVLDEVGLQRHAPAALPAGKSRYPFYRRLRGPQGRSGRVRKISPPPCFAKLHKIQDRKTSNRDINGC